MFLKAVLYLGIYGTNEKIHKVTVKTEMEIYPILCIDRRLETSAEDVFFNNILDCVGSYCEDDF